MADRYWIGGTGTWDSTNTANWSSTSGGSGGASVPTSADNVFFDANSNIGTGAFTVTTGTAAANCLNFNTTGLDGAMTLTLGGALNIYGSLTVTSNFTLTGSANTISFLATTSQTITTNGRTLDAPITFNGVGGSWALQDTLTVGSSRTTTLTSGTINLNGNTLYTGIFSSSNTNARSVTSATAATIACTRAASVSVFSAATSTNMSFSATITIDLTGGGAFSRSISLGALGNGITPSLVVGGDGATISFVTAANFNNVTVTNTTCTLSTSNIGTANIFGNLNVQGASPSLVAFGANFRATSGVKTITTNGRVLSTVSFSGAGGTWQLQDALTLGASATLTHSAGTLDLNNFTITCSAFNGASTTARTLAFGTGKIVASASVSTSTNTALSVTGTPRFEITGNSVNITLGTTGGYWTEATALDVIVGAAGSGAGIYIPSTATSLTLGGVFRDVNLTGVTANAPGALRTIFGSYFSPSTITYAASTLTTTFAATSGSKTITTSGVVLDFPVAFTGLGGTWQLQDALTLGTSRTLLHSAGTLDLNGKTLTAGVYSSASASARTLNAINCSIVLAGSGTVWSTSSTLTLNASGSTITVNSASAKSFVTSGKIYGTLVQSGAGALTISGGGSFADIKNTVQPTTVQFNSAQTFTFSQFSLSGTIGNLVAISSTTAGSRATISKSGGVVSVSYCSVQDIQATGATWQAYTDNGNVDAGNNIGWLFAVMLSSGAFLSVF